MVAKLRLLFLPPLDQHYLPMIPLTLGRKVTLHPLGQLSNYEVFIKKIRAFASLKTIKLCTTILQNKTSLATLWMFCWQNWSWEPLVK